MNVTAHVADPDAVALALAQMTIGGRRHLARGIGNSVDPAPLSWPPVQRGSRACQTHVDMRLASDTDGDGINR
jgi:hypothetical protein